MVGRLNEFVLETRSVLQNLPPDGANAVLLGVVAEPLVVGSIRATWGRAAHDNFRVRVKAVTDVIDGRDWHWPWFEQCLEIFAKHKIWPDNSLGWGSFEPVKPEPMPKTPDDSLNWLSLKEVRAILKTEGVKATSAKRADAYNALYHQVPYERWRLAALSNWRADAGAATDPGSQSYARIELLVHTLSSAEYLAHRAVQICESINFGPHIKQAKVTLVDQAAKLICGEALRASPLPGLPPFYPGDRSDIRLDFG